MLTASFLLLFSGPGENLKSRRNFFLSSPFKNIAARKENYLIPEEYVCWERILLPEAERNFVKEIILWKSLKEGIPMQVL